jgi:hypothetical protein
MGREIRRVPANWQHPIVKDGYGRDRRQPMFDETFDKRFAEWLANFDRIRAGNLDDIERECYPRGLADWLQDEGAPPDPAYYRPWSDGDATWYQVWETVSEGTPVSPAFATEDELVDYLAKNGDEWDQKRGDRPWGRQQAERFVKDIGWSPSFAMKDGKLMSGVEAVTRKTD